MAASSSNDSETRPARVEEPKGDSWNPPMTRGGLLKTGAAVAAAGGVAATLGGKAGVAGAAGGGKNRWKHVKFRGYVRYDTVGEVVNLKLIWPIKPRQILIRTQATQACYTITSSSLSTTQDDTPGVPGHGAVGEVVLVGDDIRRFQVGDRALVAITPQCGQCYNCLLGRSDMCQFLRDHEGYESNPIFATLEDGREVGGGRGGFSELMVVNEEWACPIFTDHDAAEISLLSCVGAVGFGMSGSFVTPDAGSDVVVFGAGPIGLSIINGAAVHSAGQIICVEPIAYRREVALRLGATHAVDPTGKDTTLAVELREMCKGRTPRFFAGGRNWEVAGFGGDDTVGGGARGPDYVYEATGGQRFDPSERGIEPQPDPTGILPLQQLWGLIPNYGHGITTSVGQMGNVTIPAGRFTNAGKTLHSAQYGGVDLMKDIPRFVNLIERGIYRTDLIATKKYPLEQARQAIEDSAYRTTVSAHVVYDTSKELPTW